MITSSSSPTAGGLADDRRAVAGSEGPDFAARIVIGSVVPFDQRGRLVGQRCRASCVAGPGGGLGRDARLPRVRLAEVVGLSGAERGSLVDSPVLAWHRRCHACSAHAHGSGIPDR